MGNTEIVVSGIVVFSGKSEFEGKKSWKYQFSNMTEKGLNVLNVKSNSDLQISEGDDVELIVSCSAYEGSVYFLASGKR